MPFLDPTGLGSDQEPMAEDRKMKRVAGSILVVGLALGLFDSLVGFGHAQPGGPPINQQILQAVTSLQSSVETLQSSVTALQSGLATLQSSVAALGNQSNVRLTSTVNVAPDQNAGCTIVNVATSVKTVHTQLLDFRGTVLDEATSSLEPGQAMSAAGLNGHEGSSQKPVYCKFIVLNGDRSDIRAHVEHVQHHVVIPAE